MREFLVDEEHLGKMFLTVTPHLDERQRRILAGAQARCLGRGGIVSVSETTGMSRSTVQSAIADVETGVQVTGRVRAPGGGRPKAEDGDPTLLDDLDGAASRSSTP